MVLGIRRYARFTGRHPLTRSPTHWPAHPPIQGVTFEDVQTIMADVDEDGSGGVDKEEFTELIRKNADYI